jgi:hypothetical protein
VAELRSCLGSASARVSKRFSVDDKGNWSVPMGLVVGTSIGSGGWIRPILVGLKSPSTPDASGSGEATTDVDRLTYIGNGFDYRRL